MVSGKRERGGVSTLPLTPPTSSPATSDETDSQSPALSPGSELRSQKRAKSFKGTNSKAIITRAVKEKVRKMRSSPEFLAIAFTERCRQARIYARTRSTMRVRTNTMLALALRDYQRQQYAPTRRTRPRLHKRRYSIDVNSGEERRRFRMVSHFPVQHRGRKCLNAHV